MSETTDESTALTHATDYVKARLAAGDSPNDIVGDVEAALDDPAVEAGWALFGDGNWRRDTCCSICGSWCAGICGHEKDPAQEVIEVAEFKRRKATA